MADRLQTRRRFLSSAAVAGGSLMLAPTFAPAQSRLLDSVLRKNRDFVGDNGPPLDPALVQEFVRISHFDFDGVKQMLASHPGLLNAAWDWGGGDFETGLGAASHVGNRDIALHFIESGARPNLFAVTMLGKLDIVKGFLSMRPELINCKGPHGLSLIHHARKGGKQAKDVLEYLEELGKE